MIGLSNLIRNPAQFKILIVDDEAPVRRAVRNILKELGFEDLREARDGEEALQKIRAASFDFVFCDWNMPQANGLVVLLNIRNDPTRPNLPCLILAEEKEERHLVEIIGPDEDGLLTKPVSRQALEEKMSEVLFKKLPPSPDDGPLQAAGRHIADGELTLAHEELDRAARLAPRNPLIGYFRRLVFEAEGQPEKAEEAAELARRLFKAVVLGPKKAKQRILQGRMLLSDGRVEEALQAFKMALELDPDNPERKLVIGEALLAQGMPGEAEKMFQDYVRSAPDSVFIYNRLGLVYRRQKKFDLAIQYYLKALAMDPDEEYIHYNLARAFLRAGQPDQAAESLKKAVSLQPGFKEARELLNGLADES
ncbi:MAG: tetratricopeptide repeat protein [Thermodesulfobacteriota bacterium]